MNKYLSSVLFARNTLIAPRAMYFLMFGISGFAGLMYESIWSHYLKLFLGHAAYAQSLVLIIFMGGMALGSWAASRYLVKDISPLLFYAAAEFLVGCAGLVFHDTFSSLMEFFYDSVLSSTVSSTFGVGLKWLVAGCLIMPQSVLLGMTFPLMSAGVIRRYPRAPGSSIAMLYFTNSIGAAAGVLASGFWLIGFVGLPGTIVTAGLLNIALALAIWILVRLDPSMPGLPFEKRIKSGHISSPASLFLFAAFVTGTASFIYEISWIRMLSLVLGSTTHSFELILSAFIVGLALGGLWIKKRLDHIVSPIRFAGYVQLIMGAFALLTVPIYVGAFDGMEWVLKVLGQTDAGYDVFHIASHSIALLVMLPTTVMAGMTLPLFTYALIGQGHGEKSIGQIYAANTTGAIIGVLVAVHVGLPFLGLKQLIVLGAGLDISLGLILLFRRPIRWSGNILLTTSGLISLAGLIVFISTMTLPSSVLVSGVFRSGVAKLMPSSRVSFYKDGKTATVAVTENAGGIVTISTNGKPDASIQMNQSKPYTADEVTMVLAGVLPMAYMPNAKTAATIGMGSGLTTHVLLASEGIRKVDTIEIEPAIVAGAYRFKDRVQRAYMDPRSNIHIEDAKTFFSLNQDVYDIIVAEPSNPWVSGVASLFTTEFYSTIQHYLAKNGLFAQWIQLYEFDDVLMNSILKALASSFSDFVVYMLDGGNILVIAKNSGELSDPDWSHILSGPIAEELKRVGVDKKSDLLVRRVIGGEHLELYLEGSTAPINSDYFPYVDLNAGRARFKKSVAQTLGSFSVAPLPVVEMLSGEIFDHSQVTHTRFLGSVAMHMEARWVHRNLFDTGEIGQGNSYSRPSVPLTGYLTHSLRRALSSCTLDSAISDFRFILHDVMRMSLPFLNPDDGISLVNMVAEANCAASEDSQTVLWLNLYRAVAHRDANGMSAAARRLLENKVETPIAVRSYVVAAAMLGDLTAGEPGHARDIWSRYSSKAFPNDSGPEYVELLRRLAIYGSGGSAASSPN